MKIKYIDGTAWPWLKTWQCDFYEGNDIYKGKVSVVSKSEVRQPLKVDYEDSEKLLFDDGYYCVCFLPDDSLWCAYAVFDREQRPVEWYIDILKSQDVDKEGKVFYYDLYLDVVVRPDFKAVLLDEDELIEAMEEGIITQADVDLAYDVAKYLVDVVAKDRIFLVDFMGSYLPSLDTMIGDIL